MGQVVNSHAASIKKIETQISQMSAKINQSQKGILSSDTLANPNVERGNANQCITIITQGRYIHTLYSVD